MKGKRIFIGLLAFILLFSGCATAETKSVLRLWDFTSNDVNRAFWLEHPELGYTNIAYNPFDDLLRQIEQTQPDALILNLWNDDLNRCIDAGLTADLSSSPAIAQAVSRMAPWIQALVTTEGGQILALPTGASVSPFYWYQDAWDAAGLTEEDVPQSYTELLDFLDAWARNPTKGVCASRLLRWHTGKEQYDYMYWLTELLLLSHEMQQRYAGEAVTFNTPEFIELARRSRETGEALYQAEPRQSKRGSMLQLFQSDIYGGEHANKGRPYGMSHTVPLRITSDQPKLSWLRVKVAFIRRGSPQFEEALLLLEQLLQTRHWQHDHILYMDFAPGDYPYEGGRTGRVDEGWLADYRGYDGAFVAYPLSFNESRDGEALSGKEKLMMRFFAGQITAEDFAQKLDELLW